MHGKHVLQIMLKKKIYSLFLSAIIEHTNQVIFMEDDDLAVVRNGALTIHRTQHGEVTGQAVIREIHELKIELQQIMKGIQRLSSFIVYIYLQY
jgi:glucosamine 6-phosphate synthetase-like amidotransferase/phosphosugar isomerase protein